MPQRRSATCNRIFLVLASESSLAHCDLGKAEGFWQNQRSEGSYNRRFLYTREVGEVGDVEC